ncbi:MAG: tRNA (adenosine(37)-N6)-threonylcarbamoyltransferase complex ATPase subunit type 1 TsaE [Actinobacteria bacterium]|nr:tRNA (adenosine(37)-N6)-threonylcarbamoyltransferase complex ATPase subunit type 1 TsaE [Actinomycetota bacterium]MCB9389830.1 tRNA (adenosine(37)-N6)-threonylcarbamoyltransferase complex ATPase subunit type 1 TsaE [Acidimicrobiia bacterium]
MGAVLGPELRPGDVVVLDGDVGAGKSVFVRGLLRALGWRGPVLSPTFTLFNEYEFAGGPLSRIVHGDLYRLDTVAELNGLGLDEYFDGGTALVIEWGGVAEGVWGDDVLTLTFDYVGVDAAHPERGVAEGGASRTAPATARQVTIDGVGRFLGRIAELDTLLARVAVEEAEAQNDAATEHGADTQDDGEAQSYREGAP